MMRETGSTRKHELLLSSSKGATTQRRIAVSLCVAKVRGLDDLQQSLIFSLLLLSLLRCNHLLAEGVRSEF